MRLEMAKESFLERLRRERDELAAKPAGAAPSDDLSSFKPSKSTDHDFEAVAAEPKKTRQSFNKKVFDESEDVEDLPLVKKKKTKSKEKDDYDSGVEVSKPPAKKAKTPVKFNDEGTNLLGSYSFKEENTLYYIYSFRVISDFRGLHSQCSSLWLALSDFEF